MADASSAAEMSRSGVELTDGAVTLRPFTEADIPAVTAACQDAESQRWAKLLTPFRPEDARYWVEEWVPAAWAAGTGWLFAVADAATDNYLGSCDLRPTGGGIANVGYLLAPHARGRGVMTAALRLITRWGFAEHHLARIEWYAEVGNVASRRAAERAGFRVEGVLRHRLQQRGVRVDAWVAALLPDDDVRDVPPATAALLPTVLHTGRLTLRPFEIADVPAVLAAGSDPALHRWLPTLPHPYSHADAVHYVERAAQLPAWEATGITFAAAENVGGALVGSFGLLHLDRRAGTAEIGYWVAPQMRGRGYATEATEAVTRWALDALGLVRIELQAAVDNHASNRVAAKAGFVREGIRRSAVALPDGRHDVALWSLLALR